MINDYVELHSHSYFSLLDGASSPEDLVKQATSLGMQSLALTDHDAVYGAVRFHKSAKSYGIHPIYGAEITLEGEHRLTLLVKDETGWNNLCYLISVAQHNAPKGKALLPTDRLYGHTSGLIALSGCRKGAIPQAILKQNRDEAVQLARQYQKLFGRGNFWIELQNHLLQEDRWLVGQLAQLANRMSLNTVATNNVHYANHEKHRLQDVLVCIRHNTTLEEADHLCRPNSEYYFKSSAQMRSLFHEYPQAITNTVKIAEQCTYELEYGLQDLPAFDVPNGVTATNYLHELCKEGAQRCYGDVPSRIQERLDYELSVIERGKLSNYFLIVWDIISYAKASQIRCQGRGSAANSLVAYLLGITPIDPLEHNLVFERFFSDERRLTPDIDIDFDANRREEVIQYVYRKYGHDHAAMASTLVTFRRRMSVRDVGKALGLPQEGFPMAVARYGEEYVSEMPEYREIFETEHYSPWRQLLELSEEIRGFPRHVGIHNGGMIITKSPIFSRVPTEPATMKDRYVVQWDKDSLDDAGLVKIDILGLRMLSAVSEAVEIASKLIGKQIDLDKLQFDDPAVYAMISKADTVGVFQVESRAQAQMIPRFKPTKFTDLIVAISLIRPGPIQGDMVHPYLRRRLGTERVTYPHPLLETTLKDTLGVILFQEDVIKVARDLAGFTPGQGELLRRALGAKNATEAIDVFREEFVSGALGNGVTQDISEDVFNKLCAFGSYSFPKSHAAAFAVLVYQSAWLKCYYPSAFYIAILNNQPMGFWTPAIIVNDAKRHNMDVLPVDVNVSDAKCKAENGCIRLGFNYIRGLGEIHAQRIEDARHSGDYANLYDFCRRTRLPKRLVENLILAGAMDRWGKTRRALIWELGQLDSRSQTLELQPVSNAVTLPELTLVEAISNENEILGVTTGEHIMCRYRTWLTERGFESSKTLTRCSTQQYVWVAGLVVVHQSPPTAKGNHFITLEDEDGFLNVIVRPKIYAKMWRIFRESRVLAVRGEVQRQSEVINILATKALPLR